MQVKVRRFNQHQGVPFLILTSAELPIRNCFVHKIICAKEKRLKFDAINVVVVDDFLSLKIKKTIHVCNDYRFARSEYCQTSMARTPLEP